MQKFLEIRCSSTSTYIDYKKYTFRENGCFVQENTGLMLLIIFPERTTEQQIHINGYATYLYNRGSGHIPQVADQ